MKRTGNQRIAWAIAFGMMIAGLPSCAHAGAFEGIAGWEGDIFDQGYGFVALGLLSPSGPTNKLFLTRLTGSYLYYNYEDANGDVHVRAPGVGVQAGLRKSGESWAVTLLGGGDLRWERRRYGVDPDFGNAVAKGGATAQGEASFRMGARLQSTLLINYSGSAKYTYGHAQTIWQLSNVHWTAPTAWFVGVEGIGQGNYESDAIQVGGVLTCSILRPQLSLSLRGGFKDASETSTTRRQGGYVGAGLYRRF
jgi:cellulose biosynthesis protein BcsS